MGTKSIRHLLSSSPAAIMGVINATPDSFSDGGLFSDTGKAVDHALMMVEQGADILDIGGESTRPGAEKGGLQEELDRVIPVIESLKLATDTPVSIDTYKPEVMRLAVRAGASMINDINGLRAQGAIHAVMEAKVPVCIMHMQGTPDTMQTSPEYDDVVMQVHSFFNEQVSACLSVGIEERDIILDPGIGFGKSLHHNLALLNSLNSLRGDLACEILIGVSRKSLIYNLLGRAVDERLSASLGLAVQAVLNGAKIVRVHDVRATFDAVRAIEAVVQSTQESR